MPFQCVFSHLQYIAELLCDDASVNILELLALKFFQTSIIFCLKETEYIHRCAETLKSTIRSTYSVVCSANQMKVVDSELIYKNQDRVLSCSSSYRCHAVGKSNLLDIGKGQIVIAMRLG